MIEVSNVDNDLIYFFLDRRCFTVGADDFALASTSWFRAELTLCWCRFLYRCWIWGLL